MASTDPIRIVAPLIGEAEIAAVVSVLQSGQLAQGPVVTAFEAAFAKSVGAAHAVAVNSGTAAIHCGLAALGVEEGDTVLTTPFTFAATATPILMQHGKVRFVDIDPHTFNVDLSAFARAADAETKAVVAVDLFGLPFDRSGIAELSSKGVAVFDDACQAIGAQRDGRSPGSDCSGAAFSFYATKNLMMGEGGVFTTNDAGAAEAARRFRQHGMSAQYEYTTLGYNYRLTDVLAAVGLSQLDRLAQIGAARRANAAYYDEHLRGLRGVATPFVPSGVQHGYHQYSILIDQNATMNGANRDDVRATLAERGVASAIYYPKPLHLHSLFGGAERQGEFPIAERVAKCILALPIHPRLTPDDLARVVEALRAATGA